MRLVDDRRSLFRDRLNDFTIGDGSLPDIFKDVLSPADPLWDFGSPWREDPEVVASDGAMVVRMLGSKLRPSVLAGIAARSDRQPARLAEEIQRLGPFNEQWFELPAPATHEMRPPTCTDCKGTGCRAGLLGTSNPCSECGGKGAKPRAGIGIEIWEGFWIDRWYADLLGFRLAKIFLPTHPKCIIWNDVRYAIAPIKFTIGHVTGYVMTWTPPEVVQFLESGAVTSGKR